MRGLIIGCIVVGALGLALAGSYVSAFNTGNKLEQSIVAVYENNENILAQYGQKVQEAAQIPGMQADDMLKVVTGALSARYGPDGSKAMMQWIKEQNPNIDSSVYTKIQQIIEAGRNEFTVAQQMLVDNKRAYKTNLGSFWTGTWMGFAGYPNIKVGYPIGSQDDYPIITTARAKDAFVKGAEDGPIKLRAD